MGNSHGCWLFPIFLNEVDRGAGTRVVCTPAQHPRISTVGASTCPLARGSPPEKGMLGISCDIGVRLVLGVVDVCGHAGGVGLVVRGL